MSTFTLSAVHTFSLSLSLSLSLSGLSTTKFVRKEATRVNTDIDERINQQESIDSLVYTGRESEK